MPLNYINLKVFILKRITVGLKKIVGLKVVEKFLFRKISGKKFGSKRNFWCGQMLCPKIFLFEKIWVPKKVLSKLGH